MPLSHLYTDAEFAAAVNPAGKLKKQRNDEAAVARRRCSADVLWPGNMLVTVQKHTAVLDGTYKSKQVSQGLHSADV